MPRHGPSRTSFRSDLAREPGRTRTPLPGGRDARALRILAEYLEPLSRFQRPHVQDTIEVLGSARLKPREAALAALAEAEKTCSPGGRANRRGAVGVLRGRALPGSPADRVVQATGPRGAPVRHLHRRRARHHGSGEPRGLEARGYNRSQHRASIEQFGNPISAANSTFEFHYFFMRKLWFAYLAKAIAVFPAASAPSTSCSRY